MLAWATFAAAWAVLYVGTVVTGSGPHAGDADTERNGLDPLQVSQLHADLVFLFVGLTLGLLFTLMAAGGRPAARARGRGAAGVELAQGSIGFVQYFTDLPVVLVGFHMLGAALISAAVTWALLEVRDRLRLQVTATGRRTAACVRDGRRPPAVAGRRPPSTARRAVADAVAVARPNCRGRRDSAREQRVERDRDEEQREVEVRGVEQPHRLDHARGPRCPWSRPHIRCASTRKTAPSTAAATG